MNMDFLLGRPRALHTLANKISRITARVATALTLAFITLGQPLRAFAESTGEAGAGTREALREEGFVPAEYAVAGDNVPGGLLLVAAYFVFFGLLLAYVNYIARRQAGVARDLSEVRTRLEDIDDELGLQRAKD